MINFVNAFYIKDAVPTLNMRGTVTQAQATDSGRLASESEPKRGSRYLMQRIVAEREDAVNAIVNQHACNVSNPKILHNLGCIAKHVCN